MKKVFLFKEVSLKRRKIKKAMKYLNFIALLDIYKS